MMPAGKYYIGDLCYVMHGEWDEFCDITISGSSCLDGEFSLKDGRLFASYGTMHGDGCYDGLSVDAGLIGCIRVEDIDLSDDSNDINLGMVVEFDRPFSTGSRDGVIFFGDEININTNGCEEEEEDYND